MSCKKFESALIAYHFGTIDLAERQALESHFLECSSCLKAYFVLKANLEAAGSIRPSDRARLRLRREVLAQVNPKRPKWQLPFALALAASVVLCSNFVMHLLTPSSGTMPRHAQESLLEK